MNRGERKNDGRISHGRIGQADRRIHRQAGRQTDRLADKQTERQRD